MKRRVISCVLGIIAVLMAIIGVDMLASKSFIKDEVLEEMGNAYFEYMKPRETGVTFAYATKYAGKYHGNVVAVAFCCSDRIVPAVEVEYYVDDMYICMVGDATHEIIVYTKDKQIKTLEEAYHDGTMNVFDLFSIKLALIDNCE